jgi:hypothetical protein
MKRLKYKFDSKFDYRSMVLNGNIYKYMSFREDKIAPPVNVEQPLSWIVPPPPRPSTSSPSSTAVSEEQKRNMLFRQHSNSNVETAERWLFNSEATALIEGRHQEWLALFKFVISIIGGDQQFNDAKTYHAERMAFLHEVKSYIEDYLQHTIVYPFTYNYDYRTPLLSSDISKVINNTTNSNIFFAKFSNARTQHIERVFYNMEMQALQEGTHERFIAGIIFYADNFPDFDDIFLLNEEAYGQERQRFLTELRNFLIGDFTVDQEDFDNELPFGINIWTHKVAKIILMDYEDIQMERH